MPGIDISIIIPTYNRLWSLPKAIESCKNTSCTAEIIVVDDGSTDGTWEWLLKQKDIIILKQQNWGKCWAVNNAFNHAKGKYVRFLDSDDQLVAGANDEQYELAEANSSDIVVSGYLLTDENNEILNQQPWVICDDFIAQQLGECDSSHYSAYLFRKSFIEDIPHRPDYAFRDDRLFVLEVALKNPKVSVHSGFSLLHMQHNKSRLQKKQGLQQSVQNYQHINIYKNSLKQLEQRGELTFRRKKASVNALWHLCKWTAKSDVYEAKKILEWITLLDPQFVIPDKGAVGLMYKTIGFNASNKLLFMIRFLKYQIAQ